MALVGKAFGLGGLTGVAIKKSMGKKPKVQTPSAPTPKLRSHIRAACSGVSTGSPCSRQSIITKSLPRPWYLANDTFAAMVGGALLRLANVPTPRSAVPLVAVLVTALVEGSIASAAA